MKKKQQPLGDEFEQESIEDKYCVNSMKTKKEDFAHKNADSLATHPSANKVLPITDTSPSSLLLSSPPFSASISTNDHQCGLPEKKEKPKGDNKTKAIARMKRELLRWAAAAKSDKGGKYISRKVMYFRNRGMLKAVPDDDQLSNDSPKISFRWDVESYSTTTSSVYSAFSMASSSQNDHSLNILPIDFTPRNGNWITSDSEFVVLEL